MDGIPSTYPSSYPPPAPIPVPAGPGYDQQYDHAGQQYADAHYAAPAAAAAAMDPPNITYGYPPKAEPQIIIQNTTVASSEPGCECGVGWILFGVGWFIYFAWIVGAIMYCTPQKPKDKPGLLGGLIMSIIGAILIIIVVAASNAS